MADTLIETCPHCHTRNRIPRERVGHQAKCGKCGSLFTVKAPVSSPVTVTDTTFSQEVLHRTT